MQIGQKLKEARLSVGLTLDEAGRRVGIAASSLSEFETGKREPKISQLADLSRCYNRSLTFLVEDDEVTEPEVLWRLKPEGSTAKEQKRRFLRLCEQYRHLETWCDDFIEPRLPKVEGRHKPLNYGDVEILAERVRRELNLGDRPAFVLLRALESDCGIKIFHDNFEPTGTAACISSPSLGMAVLLNSKNTPERRNFDLAHELFHLLVWDCFRSDAVSKSVIAEETEEKLAGCFASCLLLPPDVLRRAINRRLESGKIPVVELPEVAQEFGVSVEALMWGLYRAFNMGEGRKEEIKQLINGFRSEQESERQNDPKEPMLRPPKYPERYRALAIRALNEGEMSVGKFMEYMEVGRREAMSHLRQEEDMLGEVQVAAC
jgi:XRE family transcriptional regulator, fatty acid utilization regulator